MTQVSITTQKTIMTVGRVSRDASIYGIGTLLRHMTALVMLPIYTRYLDPADYGAIEMLTMALEIAGILMGLRISQAMFRFYILEENENKKKLIVSTVYVAAVILSVIGVFTLEALSPVFVKLLFGNLEYLTEFRLFVFTLVTMAISNTGMVYIQAQQRPALYVVMSALTLVLQVSGNIYFVVYRELHVLGVVYSALISGLAMSVILSVFVVRKAGLHINIEILSRLVRFVYPLIAASVAGFYVAYSDKYFIRLFDDLASVGLYALAGRLASITATFYSTFNQSWSAARFEIYKQENFREIFNQVFKLVSVASVLVAAGLVMFSKDVVYFMTDESYHAALKIIPLFVLAVFIRLYVPFFNFGILLTEKTKFLAYASWIKAAVSTILYLFLIPSYGITGAVVALLLSNCVETVYVYVKSQNLFDMGLNIFPVIMVVVSCVPMLIVGWLIPVGTVFDTFIRVILYLVIMLTFFFLPIWSKQEKEYAISLLSRFKKNIGRA